MNFSEIVAQQQTRCRRLLAAAVFSQQRQTQIFRKIFWSEVARTYVRVSTWLPLCALQLDKIDPFLSPGLRYTAVILVKRNFVERNSIFWDLSVCTTLHNASIGHFQGWFWPLLQAQIPGSLRRNFFAENSSFLMWRHGFPLTEASPGPTRSVNFYGCGLNGNFERRFQGKNAAMCKTKNWKCNILFMCIQEPQKFMDDIDTLSHSKSVSLPVRSLLSAWYVRLGLFFL